MEEVDYEEGETLITNIKKIELNEGNVQYICQLQINNDYINVSLYENKTLKYKGYINISNIQYNLGICNFEIKDIFDEIYTLNNNKFKIIKDINKYQLKIEFKILNKKRYIYIDLNENENVNNVNDYIKTINELKEIIKSKDNKIKLLEKELNKYKSNFNIELEEPKHILDYHTGSVRFSTVLKDGRFVTSSGDNSIIIYNKETFKPDLTIKEHNDYVNCVIELSSGKLASCSDDNTIKIYNINGNEYKVIQTLKEHIKNVSKIIELKNEKLVSCSFDESINFYNKVNDEYKKDYSFKTNGPNGPIIQTKDNEICYHEHNKISSICFFDINENKMINKIDKIGISSYSTDCLLMISKDLLLIAGIDKISIVNVKVYKTIKILNVYGSDSIYTICMLNKDMILTGDEKKRIMQWKIKNDNLKLISKKENAHDDRIYTISKIGNDRILSGSRDKLVKIW